MQFPALSDFSPLFTTRSRRCNKARQPLAGLEVLEDRIVLAASLQFTDYAGGISVDSNENQYVYYKQIHGTVDLDPSPDRAFMVTGTDYATLNDANGRFLVKYSPNRAVLWAKRASELPVASASSVQGGPALVDLKVVRDQTGIEHLYTFGNSVSKLTLDGELAATGWTTSLSTRVTDGYVDADGKVYGIGYIQNVADLDVVNSWGDNRDLLTVKGQGIFVAKWSAGGQLEWARAIEAATSTESGSVVPGGLAVTNGIVYVGGQFDGPLSLGGLTNQRIDASSSKYDGFLASYDTNGSYRSVAHFIDAPLNHVRAVGNEVYITATFGYTADMDPGPGQKLLTPVNYNGDALAVARLSYNNGDAITQPTWNLDWAHGFVSTYQNLPGGLQVSNGHVYVSGHFGTTTDFDPDPNVTRNLVAGGGGDIFVMDLTAATGSLGWVSQIGSTRRLNIGPDQENVDLVLGLNGRLHLGGHVAHGPVHFSGPGGATNPILIAGLDTDAFVGKMGIDGTFHGGFNVGAATGSIDNGDVGYSEVGTWKASTAGWDGDSRTSAKGTGSNKARWTFTNLPNGTYQVVTRFPVTRSAASNAPFRVTGVLTTIDQRNAPDDYFVGIVDGYWESLGTCTVTNGTLQVELTNAANGTVIADAVRIWFVAPPSASNLSASTEGHRGRVQTLTADQVSAVYAEAVYRWEATGAKVSAIQNIDVQIADLSGSLLGTVAGSTIFLDSNAAGWGWYIDATPEDDNEFLWPGNQGEKHRIDLLTVLMHEMGHILGVEHQEQGLMAETLAAGTRHSPENGTSDEFFAQLGDDANAYASLWFAESESLEQKKAARVRTKRSPALHDLRTFHQGRGGI